MRGTVGAVVRYLTWMGLLWALAGCGGGVPVRFDSSVPGDQQGLMQDDFNRLGSLQLQAVSANQTTYLGVPDMSAQSLQDWLARHIKIIVGENFDWKSNAQLTNRPGATTYVMTQASVLDPQVTAAAKTVMWNLSSYLYLDGKSQSSLYSLNLSSGTIMVTDTRGGVVQIGEGLFSVNRIGNSNPSSMANSLLRLATYFHEGRHGDGNGTNAAFPHAQCPSGTYKDLYACEGNLNGPYAIQTEILTSFYYACTECSQTDYEGLALSIADYRSRLQPGAQARDIRPEAMAETR